MNMNDEISDFFTQSIRRRAIVSAPTIQDLLNLLTALEPPPPAEKRVKPIYEVLRENGPLERDWPAKQGYKQVYLRRIQKP